jgi:hypothetical protein
LDFGGLTHKEFNLREIHFSGCGGWMGGKDVLLPFDLIKRKDMLSHFKRIFTHSQNLDYRENASGSLGQWIIETCKMQTK